MRHPRLYLAHPLQTGATVNLEEAVAHYVRHVLRLKPSAPLIVFNGQGGEFSATIQQATRHSVSITVGKWFDLETESPLKINLGLGISRGERMDFALQKAVELGVSQICPIISTRTVVQLKSERKQKKHLHWEKIVQHACEQCGRNLIPQLVHAQQLDAWIKDKEGLKLFCDPKTEQNLQQLDRPDENVILLSGPEGGFTQAEREKAIAAGFTPIRLGPRILRTETAALTAIAAIQILWGDLAD